MVMSTSSFMTFRFWLPRMSSLSNSVSHVVEYEATDEVCRLIYRELARLIEAAAEYVYESYYLSINVYRCNVHVEATY